MIVSMVTLAVGAELALAGAAATAIPIAIHLLSRHRRTPRLWGAMRFVLEAYRKHKHRLQLERWLLLAVRCLILIVLGLALWDPGFKAVASALGMAGQDRLLCLVIDDALSTRAAVQDMDGQTTRFEQLRARSIKMVAALHGTDRVAIWRSARPAGEVRVPAVFDRDAAIKALESMRPRHARPQIEQALQRVERYLDQAKDTPPRERVLLAVVSDLGPMSLDEAGVGALKSLSEKARVLLTPPPAGAVNTQVRSLETSNHLLVAGPGRGVSMDARATLRRFGEASTESSGLLRLEARLLPNGKPLATLSRPYRFAVGQSETAVNAQLPVTPGALAEVPDAGGMLEVVATIPGDTLEADNIARAVLELRRHVRVALVAGAGSPGVLDGAKWLTLALQPDSDERNPLLDVRRVAGASLDSGTLTGIDVVCVTEPNTVTDQGWESLARFTKNGGVLWVFPPSATSPSTWAGQYARALALPWEVALESQSHEDGGDWVVTTDPAATPVPEELGALAGDWQALLSPLRVSRRLNLSSTGPDARVWMSVEADGGARPWVVGQKVGHGYTLLSLSALDVAWSNLTTKPVFVPLLHEAVSSLLNRSVVGNRDVSATSGDGVELGGAWLGVESLKAVGGDETLWLVRTPEGGVRVREAVDEPGVYLPLATGGLSLTVSVDADAGDTRTLSREEVERRLSPVADWRWVDTDATDPFAEAQTAGLGLRMGWPLLWLTLALVLLETLLAKWFSHARDPNRPSIRASIWRVLHGGGE
ncbi:MAG: hypothetical protein GC164_01610 [Phycisphaera sp.]|nr:hypothetical protein [Phycisphaera sp.]